MYITRFNEFAIKLIPLEIPSLLLETGTIVFNNNHLIKVLDIIA